MVVRKDVTLSGRKTSSPATGIGALPNFGGLPDSTLQSFKPHGGSPFYNPVRGNAGAIQSMWLTDSGYQGGATVPVKSRSHKRYHVAGKAEFWTAHVKATGDCSMLGKRGFSFAARLNLIVEDGLRSVLRFWLLKLGMQSGVGVGWEG